MPEGPSIVILKESVAEFEGKKILIASGSTSENKKLLTGKKIVEFRSWGKHFLIIFPEFFIKIHFMLFGSYSINEQKENRIPKLHLKFKKGEINFYACSVKIITGKVEDHYNWKTDVMSEKWDPAFVNKLIKEQPTGMVCDVLMNQEVFTGVGNIIKNEVLFRVKLNPKSIIGAIPATKMKSLIKQASLYSFEFYEWKKLFVLKQHWKIYKQKMCPRCDIKPEVKNTGEGKRKSYYCKNCQQLYK